MTQTAPPRSRADRESYAATKTGLRCAQCLYKSAVVSASLQIGSADVAAVGGGDCDGAAGSENAPSRRGSPAGVYPTPDLLNSAVARTRNLG